MSKRSTTGQPKPAQPKPEAAPKGRLQPKLIREYRSKAEREAEVQRLIILGTALLAGIALLILVIAVANDQLIVPGQSVANVNGTNITVGQFKTRAKLERTLLIQELNRAVALMQGFGMDSNAIQQQLTSDQRLSSYLSELQVADQLGNSVLNSMVEDELVRQKARELGVEITDAEVDARINEFFNYDPEAVATEPTATPTSTPSPTPLVSPTPSPVPTSTPTPELTSTPTLTPFPSATPTETPDATERANEFNTQRDEFFAGIRSAAGLSDADIREYFRMQVLREKVRDAVLTDISRTAPFVNARHILVDNEETAQNLLQALQSGESFASLAQSVSSDGSAAQGGELGWAPVSNYVTEFADAVKTAEIGVFVGPVQSQFGYHIVQVRAREDREMTDDEYEQAKNTEFNTYLEDLRAAETTSVEIYDTWTNNVPTEPVFTLSL